MLPTLTYPTLDLNPSCDRYLILLPPAFLGMVGETSTSTNTPTKPPLETLLLILNINILVRELL